MRNELADSYLSQLRRLLVLWAVMEWGDGLFKCSSLAVFPYYPRYGAPSISSYSCEQDVQLAIYTYAAYVLELERFENDVGSWEGKG